MSPTQTKLLARLRIALDIISKSTETESEMTAFLTDVIFSFEEVASDLLETSDEQIASDLKEIMNAASIPGNESDAVDSNTLFLLSDLPTL